MQRLIWLTLMVTYLIPGIASCAGKLTVDPNSPEGKRTEVKKEMPDFDKRLLQKVTYDSGYTRLHTILEQLSEQTGVKVRCARNSNDWQVRDIPVVVCAKDMTLWDLLKTIANSTHLILSYDKAGETWFYRIWRDPRTEKMLARSVTDKQDALKATDAWAWDALTKLADVPESAVDMTGMDDNERMWALNSLDMAKIVAALGPEGKDNMLSGGKIGVTTGNLQPDAGIAMENILKRMWNSWDDMLKRLTEGNPGKGIENMVMDDDRLRRSGMTFQPALDDSKEASVFIHVPLDNSGITVGGGGALSDYAGTADKVKGYDIPKRPDFPGANELAESILTRSSSGLKRLKAKEDWDLPILKIKVKLEKLEKPTKQKVWTPAEVVTALSKASGYSIICEDFQSHINRVNYIDQFESETTVGDILQKLHGFVWLIDEKHKFISGWASDWTQHHLKLVPERLVENLKTKLNGDGVDIDDLTPTAYLTWDQWREWLMMTRGLEGLGMSIFIEDTRQLWQFYDSLSPQDKVRAKSDSGLNLGEFDRRWLSAIFEQRNREIASNPEIARLIKDNADSHNSLQIPSDPEQIPFLTLRLKKTVPEMIYTSKENGRRDLVQTPKDFKKHEYIMEISGEIDGQPRSHTIQGPLSTYFPAYSPEREAELARSNEKEK